MIEVIRIYHIYSSIIQSITHLDYTLPISSAADVKGPDDCHNSSRDRGVVRLRMYKLMYI